MYLINAMVCPMDREDIPNGFVRVQNGRIAAVGEMAACPGADSGEEILDLKGRRLLPGFIDAHSHIGLYENGLGFEGDDLNEDSDPATPQLRALDGINPLDGCFREALESGVTCVVVSPGSINPVAGQIVAMKTSGRSIDGMVVREPLAIKLALGENSKAAYSGRNQAPVTRMATAAIIREQLGKARRYLQDLTQAQQEGDSPPDWDMKCEALIPLLKRELRAHIHAHRAYDILTGIRIAREYGLDYTIVHCTEGHLIAQELAAEGARVICGPIPSSRTKPELSNLTQDNCAKLAAAGVPVAIATDHPEIPADFLRASAAVAAANGLDRNLALAAITINAARAVALEGRLGSITVGKDADLQVYDGDPLEGYAKPDMVFLSGNLVK